MCIRDSTSSAQLVQPPAARGIHGRAARGVRGHMRTWLGSKPRLDTTRRGPGRRSQATAAKALIRNWQSLLGQVGGRFKQPHLIIMQLEKNTIREQAHGYAMLKN